MKFRTISFPFDWLFSNSIKGLKLVNENIKHNFQFFLADLEINERNYIISKHYPYTEFFHEKNLIENESDRSRLKNRANKFLNYIDKNSCTFLYVINHDHIKNEDDINEFILYINEFHQLTNYNHSLKIYVKCPTNVSEFQFIDQLITKSNNIKNTKAVHYYLDTIKYGMWGNPKDYVHLLKSLDIKVKQSIVPEILLK